MFTTTQAQSAAVLRQTSGATRVGHDGKTLAEILDTVKYLYPVVGELDAMPRIVAALNSYSTVFVIGTFPIVSVSGITLTNKALRGVRGRSFFNVDAALVTGTLFTVDAQSSIEYINFVGPAAAPVVTDGVTYANTLSEIIALKGEGALNCIKVQKNTSRVYGCEISGFTGWAIQTSKNNTNPTSNALDTLIEKNRLVYNFGGIQIPEESEYIKFLNNSICWNVYGVDKSGGNNTFTGNNIDHNRINFVTRGGLNNSHGGITGGTLNHGKLASLVAHEITVGEAIAGVNIFDAGTLGIYIKNSIGVNITGCLLGRTNIFCEGQGTAPANPGVNSITDNLFNLHGVTYQIYRDYNSATGLSDPTTPDNCVFRDNYHMEGQASRDGGAWDEWILNDKIAPDTDGFFYQQRIAGNSNSRFVSGRPLDGTEYLGDGSQAGAIKIELPVPGFNNSNCSFKIVVNTSNEQSTVYEFSAYALSGGTWSSGNLYTMEGAPHAVRFGRSAAGKALVYIGDLADSWSSALVEVREFTMHSGAYSESKNWKQGWSITLETVAFENVTMTLGSDNDFIDDLNNIDVDSSVFASSGATNKPGAVTGFCDTKVKNPKSNIRRQVFYEVTGAVFARATQTGAAGWTAWVAL